MATFIIYLAAFIFLIAAVIFCAFAIVALCIYGELLFDSSDDCYMDCDFDDY